MTGLRLDLAAGQQPREGFESVDSAPLEGVDYRVDLFQPPWPFDDDSVEEIYCAQFVEHIPHYLPSYNGVDGWWVFFAELYRVMQDGGLATFTHPYVTSRRAFQDPTHTRYITEATWGYLSRAYRTVNHVDHYGADVDFEVAGISYYGPTPGEPADPHLWEQISDLMVALRVHKP